MGPEGMESCFSNTLLMAVVLERWDGPNSRRRARSAQTGAGALGACISSKFPAASPETTARSCLGLCRLKCTQHRPKDYRGSREHASPPVNSPVLLVPPPSGHRRAEGGSPSTVTTPTIVAPASCPVGLHEEATGVPELLPSTQCPAAGPLLELAPHPNHPHQARALVPLPGTDRPGSAGALSRLGGSSPSPQGREGDSRARGS